MSEATSFASAFLSFEIVPTFFLAAIFVSPIRRDAAALKKQVVAARKRAIAEVAKLKREASAEIAKLKKAASGKKTARKKR